jgi:RNA-directed DNA polymerase
MLERAQEVTRNDKYTYIEYARFADDLVILIDAYKRHHWLIGAVDKRLREEFAKLQVEVNDEKSRMVDLERGESFGFLGFDFRYLRSLRGVWRPHYTPKLKKRTAAILCIIVSTSTRVSDATGRCPSSGLMWRSIRPLSDSSVRTALGFP